MTVRECDDCGDSFHPEESSDVTRWVNAEFGTLFCDSCVFVRILPDSFLESLRMRKEPESDQ